MFQDFALEKGKNSPEMPSLKFKAAKAKVYLDDDGIIFDVNLNQTNIGGNNNKVNQIPPIRESLLLIPL